MNTNKFSESQIKPLCNNNEANLPMFNLKSKSIHRRQKSFFCVCHLKTFLMSLLIFTWMVIWFNSFLARAEPKLATLVARCQVRDYASRWSHRIGILTFPEALRAVEEKTHDITDNIEPPQEDIFEQQKKSFNHAACLKSTEEKKTFCTVCANINIQKKRYTTTKRDGFIHTILCVACYFGCASALKFFNKDSEIKNARTTPQKTVKLLSPPKYFVC